MYLAELLLFKVNNFKSFSIQEDSSTCIKEHSPAIEKIQRKKLHRLALEVAISVGPAKDLSLYVYGRLFCFF